MRCIFCKQDPVRAKDIGPLKYTFLWCDSCKAEMGCNMTTLYYDENIQKENVYNESSDIYINIYTDTIYFVDVTRKCDYEDLFERTISQDEFNAFWKNDVPCTSFLKKLRKEFDLKNKLLILK